MALRGLAVGALLAGVLADLFSIRTAAWVVAGLTAASGALAAVRMYETYRPPAGTPPGAGTRSGPLTD